MPSKAEKLLAQMRESPKNWRRRDLETVYRGFGFVIKPSRGPHDKVIHSDFPTLITSLPRHRELAIYNIIQAIDLIDKLLALKKAKEEGESYDK
jgi:hypothetical protein